ncbi:hypothetical protein [Phormidium sp. CCY1219]|uniref:hypothetical protein n=1 Tax=Phormidium sp. CCY1219 TaxID=2886104 RepID=UPI002D1F4D29|nr:hypothetical protein [Phormidium sp. CCY1219]MEB3831477.1 hypothetical protein [Phormidium sp. CCY1219]
MSAIFLKPSLAIAPVSVSDFSGASESPLAFRFDYDYSSFGSETLQQQATQALSQFLGFIRHTFVSGRAGVKLRSQEHPFFDRFNGSPGSKL